MSEEVVHSPSMSVRGTLWTSVRHVVYPAAAGILILAIEALDIPALHIPPMYMPFVVAFLAGLTRWLRTSVGDVTLVK